MYKRHAGGSVLCTAPHNNELVLLHTNNEHLVTWFHFRNQSIKYAQYAQYVIYVEYALYA